MLESESTTSTTNNNKLSVNYLKKQVVYYILIKNKDIVLEQAANAWTPIRTKNTTKDVNNNTQNVEVTKELKLILNKLSEENLPHMNNKIARRLPIKN